MKHSHKKSRLDECKKFDEECRLRYVAEKMIRNAKIVRISTPMNLIGPKPADINPMFQLTNKEKKVLRKRIKQFKTESEQMSEGIEKFRKATLGIPWTVRALQHTRKII